MAESVKPGAGGQLELWPSLDRIERKEQEVALLRARVTRHLDELARYLAARWRLPPPVSRIAGPDL